MSEFSPTTPESSPTLEEVIALKKKIFETAEAFWEAWQQIKSSGSSLEIVKTYLGSYAQAYIKAWVKLMLEDPENRYELTPIFPRQDFLDILLTCFPQASATMPHLGPHSNSFPYLIAQEMAKIVLQKARNQMIAVVKKEPK